MFSGVQRASVPLFDPGAQSPSCGEHSFSDSDAVDSARVLKAISRAFTITVRCSFLCCSLLLERGQLSSPLSLWSYQCCTVPVMCRYGSPDSRISAYATYSILGVAGILSY